MAAVLKLDTIEGAEITYTGWNAQQVRSGVITGIEVDSLPDSQILEKALGIVLGNVGWLTNYPGFPGCLFRALRITPLSGNSVRVYLLYSTPDWGGNSAYLIRDSTSLMNIQTNFLPGTRIPFRVRWQSSATPTAGNGTQFFVPAAGSIVNDNLVTSPSNAVYDSIKLDIMIPVRSIQITQISYGQPPTSLRPLVGMVNSDSSFLGVNGVGMWLISEFTSDISKYQGSYQVSANITTKNVEDWSICGILQDKTSGQYVDVGDVNGPIMTAVNARSYVSGIIYGKPPSMSGTAPYATGEDTNGVIRVGPYPTTSFTTAFPGLTG